MCVYTAVTSRATHRVVQVQDIAALEGRLHAAAEHHDDGRLALRVDHEPLPDHERREHHHGQVQALVGQLPLVGPEPLDLVHLLLHHRAHLASYTADRMPRSVSKEAQ